MKGDRGREAFCIMICDLRLRCAASKNFTYSFDHERRARHLIHIKKKFVDELVYRETAPTREECCAVYDESLAEKREYVRKRMARNKGRSIPTQATAQDSQPSLFDNTELMPERMTEDSAIAFLKAKGYVIFREV